MSSTIQWYPGQGGGGDRTGGLEYIWTDRQTNRQVGRILYILTVFTVVYSTVHSYSYVKTQLGLRG